MKLIEITVVYTQEYATTLPRFGQRSEVVVHL